MLPSLPCLTILLHLALKMDAWREERGKVRRLEVYIDGICVEMEAKAREVAEGQQEHQRLGAAQAQLQVRRRAGGRRRQPADTASHSWRLIHGGCDPFDIFESPKKHSLAVVDFQNTTVKHCVACGDMHKCYIRSA